MGIDVSDQMIALARERWPHGQFRVGDAYALPLEDGEAAGYRADKVIHALADPRRALAEARRVLAPGGRIVVCGQDWDTFVTDSGDPELTRIIVARRADQVPSPRAARQYRNLLLDSGFRDVTVEVHTGVFTDGSFLPVLTRLAEVCCEHGAITPAQARHVDCRPAGTRPGRPAVRGRADLHGGGDQPLRGPSRASARCWRRFRAGRRVYIYGASALLASARESLR